MYTFRWSVDEVFCLMEHAGKPIGAAEIGNSPGVNDPDGDIGDETDLAVVEMLFVAPNFRRKEDHAADRLVDELLDRFPALFHTGIQSDAGRKLCVRRGIERHPVVRRVSDGTGRMVAGKRFVRLSDEVAEQKGREVFAKAIASLG